MTPQPRSPQEWIPLPSHTHRAACMPDMDGKTQGPAPNHPAGQRRDLNPGLLAPKAARGADDQRAWLDGQPGSAPRLHPQRGVQQQDSKVPSTRPREPCTASPLGRHLCSWPPGCSSPSRCQASNTLCYQVHPRCCPRHHVAQSWPGGQPCAGAWGGRSISGSW